MLFRRRIPTHPLARLGGLFWPRIGWRRAGSYLVYRVRRMRGTPHAIAAGLAAGAAISFTPFIGMHFVLAALVAWVTRGSILASAIGTVVGNPWTFPFIWVWIYELGAWVIGATTRKRTLVINAEIIFNQPLELLLPMSVGGILSAIVVWQLTYWALKPAIAAYQEGRQRRLRERAEIRAAAARHFLDGAGLGTETIGHKVEQ
ncbi:MAG: DUF2062 domain-containing protein [Proteobacteria bacterium]|nr:DUF2062 domain-containing protein [Pseudomonadota bacterium]